MSKFKVGDVVYNVEGLYGEVPGKIVYILDEDVTGFGKILLEFPTVMANGNNTFWSATNGARIWEDELPDKVVAFLKSCPKGTGYLWQGEDYIELYTGEIIEEEDCGGLKYL